MPAADLLLSTSSPITKSAVVSEMPRLEARIEAGFRRANKNLQSLWAGLNSADPHWRAVSERHFKSIERKTRGELFAPIRPKKKRGPKRKYDSTDDKLTAQMRPLVQGGMKRTPAARKVLCEAGIRVHSEKAAIDRLVRKYNQRYRDNSRT